MRPARCNHSTIHFFSKTLYFVFHGDTLMESIWSKTKAAIKTRIPGHSYRMWIEPVEFISNNDGIVVLSCPNPFSKKRVLENYSEMILAELRGISGKSCEITIEICEKLSPGIRQPDVCIQKPLFPEADAQVSCGRLMRRDFTFDQFVVGGNNDFAYSASLALASRKKTQQHSLFLLSNTGMGKTHLTQAVGNYILTENPAEKVYYISAEEFSNEMVSAYQNDTIDLFKRKYRTGCNVLLLDDVHYLSGKERTQVELAMTLDTLFDSGKKIIFSSSYLPGDIPKLNDKLRSRLSCGLISAMDPPNFRTRVRILQKKALLNGVQMPDNITQYLAGELTEDVRQLESGLIGISARSSLLGGPIDMAMAESVVKNIVRQRKLITIDVIKKLVCREFNVSGQEIISASRKQALVRARQIAMYLSRRYTDSPLQAIGKCFNRYHATALHSITAIEKGIRNNNSLQKQIEYLCGKLEEGGW
jgi:chromosomal replication initiator protein